MSFASVLPTNAPIELAGEDVLLQHDRPAVCELDRRQAAREIAAVAPLVAGLGDGEQEGIDRGAGAGRVLLVGVGEVGGAHQAILAGARRVQCEPTRSLAMRCSTEV
jgi:hypothetical protein